MLADAHISSLGVIGIRMHIDVCMLLLVQRLRSRGTVGLKLLLRDTLQQTSTFVKRFVYLAGMYHYE